MDTGRISVFRSGKLFDDMKSVLTDHVEYEEVREQFVKKYVHPEEHSAVLEMLDLENVRRRLEQVPSFLIHCRIWLEEMHYYYLQITRNGEADAYEDIRKAA